MLAFTASIQTIGPLLALFGDTGLAWGLPLYSLFMLGSWLLLRRGSVSVATVDAAPAYGTA